MAGQEAGQIELKDEIFGIEPNQNAVHAVIKNILANRRQGTQSAKTRAEVRGEMCIRDRAKGFCCIYFRRKVQKDTGHDKSGNVKI